MTKNIFILGAGASIHTGAPIMSNFLNRIRGISRSNISQDEKKDYDLVLRAFQELQLSRVNIRMQYEENIEILLASFEMAKLFGELGDMEVSEIERLPIAMRRVICLTIEESMPYPIRNGCYYPHEGYRLFSEMIKDLREKHLGCSIITFNYDIGLDFALSYYRVPYSYCLSTPNRTQEICLLKLHGSLNWAKEENENIIFPIDLMKYTNPLSLIRDFPSLVLPISRKLFIPDKKADIVPFIIPPTWNKTTYHSQIDKVWKQAVEVLSDAENIFIIGYSFPETDQFFRHLLSMGLKRGSIFEHIWIINPDESVFSRFKSIAGDPVDKVLPHKPNKFELIIPEIRKLINS